MRRARVATVGAGRPPAARVLTAIIGLNVAEDHVDVTYRRVAEAVGVDEAHAQPMLSVLRR